VIVQLVLVLLVAGFVLSSRTKPFTPHPSLARARWVVIGCVIVACPLLVASLSQVWWVVHDGEREETLTTRGTSPFPALIVAFGLMCVLLTVTAVRGGRNWAPAIVALAWLMVGAGWAFGASGEAVDSDASGEGRSGLSLAAWALLVVTIAAVVGSFVRLAEHRTSRRDGFSHSGGSAG
jgi:hypothetical protein